MPAVGKTALAIELAHDREILSHFRDGVLWARLGVEPDVHRQLGLWALALGFSTNEVSEPDKTEDLITAVHWTIGLGNFLLVIDDAWSLEAALTFQVGGPNCLRLLTTRVPDIVNDFAEKNAVLTPPLSLESTQELLMRLTPDVGLVDIKTLAHLVDGVPLTAINIGYAARKENLKGEPYLQSLVERLKSPGDRLQMEIQHPPSFLQGKTQQQL